MSTRSLALTLPRTLPRTTISRAVMLAVDLAVAADSDAIAREVDGAFDFAVDVQ